MLNITSTFPSAVGVELEWDHRKTTPNSSAISPGEIPYYRYYESDMYIALGFILFVYCIGIVGNGLVIWFLGFHINRNTYTTYILNLAGADFWVLIVIAFYCIVENFIKPYKMSSFEVLFEVFLLFTCTTSQLLLTAISMEKCVSVLFPIWHRCSRPSHLSTTVCTLIWVISFLLSVILSPLGALVFYENLAGYFLITTSYLCLPLVTVSTVILFCKFCCKSQQKYGGKPFMIISLAFLVFLILGYPLSTFVFSSFFLSIPFHFIYYGLLCASLNSSVNPLIYYLFGRKKGAHSKENMKVILQRVVNEGHR